MPGPLCRAAARVQAPTGARRGHPDPAGGEKPRRIRAPGPDDPRFSDRRGVWLRRSAPDLPGCLPLAAAFGRKAPGGRHRRTFHRNDPGPGLLGPHHGVVPPGQRGLVHALLPARAAHRGRFQDGRGGCQGGDRRSTGQVSARRLDRGLRLVRHRGRGGRHAGRQRMGLGCCNALRAGLAHRPHDQVGQRRSTAPRRPQGRPAPGDRRWCQCAARHLRPVRHRADAAGPGCAAPRRALRPDRPRHRRRRCAGAHRELADPPILGRRSPGLRACTRSAPTFPTNVRTTTAPTSWTTWTPAAFRCPNCTA